MIGLKVSLNGKRVCVAGADDLAVLNAIISASGKLGSKTVPARPDDTSEMFYSVGGLTARPNPTKDVHLRWKSVSPLRVGDVIEVEIVETDNPDRPKSSIKAKPRNANPEGCIAAERAGLSAGM
jgi:hypothetical protein